MIPVTIAIFCEIRYNELIFLYSIEMQDMFPDR